MLRRCLLLALCGTVLLGATTGCTTVRPAPRPRAAHPAAVRPAAGHPPAPALAPAAVPVPAGTALGRATLVRPAPAAPPPPADRPAPQRPPVRPVRPAGGAMSAGDGLRRPARRWAARRSSGRVARARAGHAPTGAGRRFGAPSLCQQGVALGELPRGMLAACRRAMGG